MTALEMLFNMNGECVDMINWIFGKTVVSNSRMDLCNSICKCVSISSIKTMPGILKSKIFLFFSLIENVKLSSSNNNSRESSLNIFRSKS